MHIYIYIYIYLYIDIRQIFEGSCVSTCSCICSRHLVQKVGVPAATFTACMQFNLAPCTHMFVFTRSLPPRLILSKAYTPSSRPLDAEFATLAGWLAGCWQADWLVAVGRLAARPQGLEELMTRGRG